MLPDYYYAKPRLEHVTTADKEVYKKPISWSVVPQSTFEFGLGGIFAGSVYGFNIGYGTRSVAVFKGVWKYLPAYYAGLMIARWCDRAVMTENKYDDKIIKDYMSLHPHRFPVYQPKKLIDTFEPWYPMRSGGTGYMSEFINIGRKKKTDHYVPLNNERQS